MSAEKQQRPENESMDSLAAREWGPPHAAKRREMLDNYVNDVDRLHRCSVMATLLAEKGAKAETFDAIAGVIAEMREVLEDLQRRRAVVLPKVRHKDDDVDEVFDAVYHAMAFIYNIEALLDGILNRVQEGKDGHLLQLCCMCIEQMPKLRLALYGEDMSP